MKRALAQNPNLVRTLIGLGLTLIFILSYAVYGATIDTEYYIYSSNRKESLAEMELLNTSLRDDPDGQQWTTWIWQADVNRSNLTWVNTTLTEAPAGTILKVINSAGWYSHPDLGVEDAVLFNCASHCDKAMGHSTGVDDSGAALLVGLIHTDPARRDGGTVRADSEGEALELAFQALNHTYEEGSWQVHVISPGNHSINPTIEMMHINEEFAEMHQFALDTATELLWSFAAVIGCFIIVLVPILSIYVISRLSDKKEDGVVFSSSEE